MNKLFLSIVVALTVSAPLVPAAPVSGQEEERHPVVYVEGGRHHVQGIAYDREAGRMYFSFTTSFVVTDMDDE